MTNSSVQLPTFSSVEFRRAFVRLMTMVMGLFCTFDDVLAQLPAPGYVQPPVQTDPMGPFQSVPPGVQFGPQAVPLPMGLPASQTIDKLRFLTSQYPLCVMISEDFSNHFVRSETRESGPVRDFVLGAQVVGNQQTIAVTTLDFMPHEPAARMMFVVSGSTNNQTTNYTPQAIVRSEGSYLFQLTKQVEFDGSVFKTWSPAALLTINQRNLDALTQMTGVPVIGPIANLIAINEANRRRPLAEQIAAQKVTQQVGPRFNKEIDDTLTRLNEQLENIVRKQLEKFQLTPGRLQTSSTSDALLIGLGMSETVQFGLSPPALPATVGGVQFCLHESHVNDLITRLPLAKLELPDTAFERLLNFQSGIKPDLQSMTPNLATIIFDGEQPARVFIRNGQIELELRMAFRPVIGPIIPTQRIIFKTELQLTDSLLLINSDLVSVKPLDPNSEEIFSTIAEKAVRQQMDGKLNKRELPTTLDVSLPEKTETAQLFLTSINLDAGWLTIIADVRNCPQ